MFVKPYFGRPGRHGGWAFFLLLAAVAQLPAAEPAVHFVVPQRGKHLVVEVTGIRSADLDRLGQAERFDWPSLLSIRVAGGMTDLLGSYSIEGNVLRFESRHPPSPGIAFRAVLDPRKLHPGATGQLTTAEITLPKPPTVASAVVEQIYPSGSLLPENQLRFYIHFSAPMSRQQAYGHLKLFDEKGQEVTAPFLELGEELWDPAGKRFTLLLHPGRVKRGLKPREELGPILEEGKRYTLVVASDWPDAEGNPLKAGIRKSFRVGAPDESQPDPKAWKLTAPPAGKATALVVALSKPLDHALLQRLIWVVDAEGRRLLGSIDVGSGETRWSFKPTKPWLAGRYRLVVDPALEDRAGNSIARPFELDLVQPRPQKKAHLVELNFEVK